MPWILLFENLRLYRFPRARAFFFIAGSVSQRTNHHDNEHTMRTSRAGTCAALARVFGAQPGSTGRLEARNIYVQELPFASDWPRDITSFSRLSCPLLS